MEQPYSSQLFPLPRGEIILKYFCRFNHNIAMGRSFLSGLYQRHLFYHNIREAVYHLSEDAELSDGVLLSTVLYTSRYWPESLYGRVQPM